ncbi:hypothetical protein PENTCL1PPCAC_25351, partial [Pristionchus entomophagus]
HEIVNVTVHPCAFGNRMTPNLDIPDCHMLNIRLENVCPALHLEHASTSVRHLGLVGHLRHAIAAHDLEYLLAHFVLCFLIDSEEEHCPSQRCCGRFHAGDEK